MPPLVSIIMPCLNAAPWVAEALSSCLNQTHSNIEVIFVDNGSTDGSLAIAQKLAGQKIKVTSCHKKGASAARNVGLNLAQGELIQFLDADDLLAPDKIAIQIDRLKETSFEYVASCASVRFEGDHKRAVFRPDPVWKDFDSQGYFFVCWRRGGDIPIMGWLTPRRLIESVGVWNENITFSDDREFFCRVILSSKGICFCPEAKGYYRKVPESLGTQSSDQGFKSYFLCTQLCVDHLLNSENSPRTRLLAAELFQQFIFDAYPAAPDLTRLAESEVATFGGCNLKPHESRIFTLLSSLAGWKTARRLQYAYRQLKYTSQS